MNTRTKLLHIVAFTLTGACSSGGAPAQGASDVTCPPGQSFDGQYCQVDQNVATQEAEVSAAAVAEEDESSTDESDEPSEEESTDEEAAAVDEPEEVPAAPALAPAQATPVDVTMAAQAAPIIQYLASSHLPSGARQYHAPFAAQFAEGQVFEQKIQLTAGKCYTAVAVALPPVTELNIELFAEGQEEPLAKDSTTGAQAVLGSRDACFRPPATGSYKLVLTVAGGQGVAAAQVFQK